MAVLRAMTALQEEARAKVNLTLRVLGRRTDGYHDLESVVAFAGCADGLALDVGQDLSLTVVGPSAPDCGATGDNLVLRVAKLLAEQVPELKLGAFTLDKKLPVAAGIGGGSADAAAALRLLARANDLAADDPRLLAVAAAAGADIPVCVGSRACVMTGVGENLQPLDLPAMPCVLVNPRVPVATKDVFGALGLRAGQLLVGATSVLTQDRAWPTNGCSHAEWLDFLEDSRNDLEAPAVAIAPVIDEVLNALHVLDGCRLARMSGSGATCFGLFADMTTAKAGAAVLRQANPGWWVEASVLR
jgi:4-diphosphocytidyl-2-C-methyl-D-erythritol kinase